MNMRLYMVFAGALTSLALVACSSDTDTGNTGGAGTAGAGVGGTGNTGNEGGAGTGGTGNVGGGTGGGGGAACQTCGEFITSMDTMATICEASAMFYDDFIKCVCMECGAAMGDDCYDSCTDPTVAPSAACTTCAQGTATDACKTEFDACANDI